MALAEDDPVEGGGELKVHRHPRLLAGDVQPRDLVKVCIVNIAQILPFCHEQVVKHPLQDIWWEWSRAHASLLPYLLRPLQPWLSALLHRGYRACSKDNFLQLPSVPMTYLSDGDDDDDNHFISDLLYYQFKGNNIMIIYNKSPYYITIGMSSSLSWYSYQLSWSWWLSAIYVYHWHVARLLPLLTKALNLPCAPLQHLKVNCIHMIPLKMWLKIWFTIVGSKIFSR